jgi:phosphatidylglycerophosphatase A
LIQCFGPVAKLALHCDSSLSKRRGESRHKIGIEVSKHGFTACRLRRVFMKFFIAAWLKRILGSLFFLGYIPGPSGTYGSIAVVAALWFTRAKVAPWFAPEYYREFWLVMIAAAGFCMILANNASEIFGRSDPKQFVFDEVVGQLVTFFMIPFSWRTLILGLALFRFYDIIKPFPVYKFEEIEDGAGIAMDDVAAGVLANISLVIILWAYHALKSVL